MKRRLLLLALGICFVFFSGCMGGVIEKGPKREVSQFTQKTYQLKEPLALKIDIDSSNVEIYSWEKEEIKFEIKKRVRGTEEEKELAEKLKDFSFDIVQDKNAISYKARYKKKIKNAADIGSDLRLFIPKKVRSIECMLDIGTIKFLDDLHAEVYIETNMVNIEIKRLIGKLTVKGDMGNLKLENGKLAKGSSAALNFGNIEIKAGYEEEGSYQFETHTGNIDLQLPEDLKVSFENMGTVEINDLPQKDYPTKIKNTTDMGRITIKRY